MAALAEAITETAPPPGEIYGRSLSTIRLLGGMAVEAATTPESGGILEQGFDDYLDAITEMLATDEALRPYQEIDKVKTHRYADGHVLTAANEPLVDLVRRGWASSRSAASENPQMEPQVERDEGDVIFMEAVDNLQVGESVMAVKLDPKRELAKERHLKKDDPRRTYGTLGYLEGWAYIDMAVRTGQDEVVMMSFSVDLSDEQAWRQVLAEYGVEVPAGESPNRWVRHHIHGRHTSADQAEQSARSLRQAFYRAIGHSSERRSATEYVQSQKELVFKLFKTYYSALSAAVNTKRNNDVLKNLADTMLQKDMKKLRPEVRGLLVRVANSKNFDDLAGREMDSVIRYAVVEVLRKGLPAFLKAGQAGNAQSWASRSPWSNATGPAGAEVTYLNQMLASNMADGVEAERGYGGCPGNTMMSNRVGESEPGAISSTVDQPFYYGFGGGGSRREKWKMGKGKCVISSCPTRPKEVKLGPCGVCMDRCQKLYDKGKDPSKMSVTKQVATVTAKSSFKMTMAEGENTTTSKTSWQSYNANP